MIWKLITYNICRPFDRFQSLQFYNRSVWSWHEGNFRNFDHRNTSYIALCFLWSPNQNIGKMYIGQISLTTHEVSKYCTPPHFCQEMQSAPLNTAKCSLHNGLETATSLLPEPIPLTMVCLMNFLKRNDLRLNESPNKWPLKCKPPNALHLLWNLCFSL